LLESSLAWGAGRSLIGFLDEHCGSATCPCGLAKRFWVEEGIMVPVEEADEAEDESSSIGSSGKPSVSFSSVSSRREVGGKVGKPDSLALANCLCKSLIVRRAHSSLVRSILFI
jgi:hypothetical protein